MTSLHELGGIMPRSSRHIHSRPMVVALALGVVAAGCGAPGDQDPAMTASGATPAGVSSATADSVRAEVGGFLDAYRARTQALDVEGLAEMYSSSPDFYWVEVGRRTYESADEIREGLRGLTTQVDDIAVTVDEVRVTPITRNAAAVTMRFQERMSGPDMPEFSFSGVITAVVVRESGAWRFLVGHATTESMESGS